MDTTAAAFLTAQAIEVRQADVLWALLEQGHLLSAYWFLESLQTANIASPDHPPSHLLKAAALAQYIVDDNSVAASTYRDVLTELDLTRVNRVFEQRKSLGQYALGLAASLQPSLFFPASGAPQLLRDSNHGLPPDLSRVLTDVASLGEQTFSFTLFDFGGYRQDVDVATKLAALQEKAGTFREYAIGRVKGYFWAKAALRHALSRGDLGVVLDAIINNRSETQGRIRELIRRYSTREALELLIVDSLRAALEGNQDRTSYPIVGTARNHFIAQAQRCLQYATEWLDLQDAHPLEASSSYRLERLRPTIQRISTQLPLAIEFFQHAEKSSDTLEDSAGCKLALVALEALRSTLSGSRPKRWQSQELLEWISLPRLMAGDRRDEAGSPHLAVAIAEFALQGFKYPQWAEQEITAGRLHLAHAVLHQMARAQWDEPTIVSLRESIQMRGQVLAQEYLERLKAMQSRLHDAFYANLLTDPDYRAYSALLEELEELSQSSGPMDYPSLSAEIETIGRFLDDIHRARLAQLRQAAEQLRATLQTSPRRNEVPEDWLQAMDRALTDNNLTVAEEYLGQLRAFLEEGAALVDLRDSGLRTLRAFQAQEPQIITALESMGRPEIDRCILDGGQVGPLQFTPVRDRSQGLLKAFDKLAGKRRRMTEADIQAIYSIMRAVGFRASGDYHRSGPSS